jgi:hypothetical protein
VTAATFRLELTALEGTVKEEDEDDDDKVLLRDEENADFFTGVVVEVVEIVFDVSPMSAGVEEAEDRRVDAAGGTAGTAFDEGGGDRGILVLFLVLYRADDVAEGDTPGPNLVATERRCFSSGEAADVVVVIDVATRILVAGAREETWSFFSKSSSSSSSFFTSIVVKEFFFGSDSSIITVGLGRF